MACLSPSARSAAAAEAEEGENDGKEMNVQSFLEPSPMLSSSLERRMRRSSMRWICSAS